MRDGASSRCNDCRPRVTPEQRRLNSIAASVAWQKRNPDRRRANHRAWAAKNKDKSAAKYAKTKAERPDLILKWSLWSKYKITDADFARMAKEQGHGCAICGGQPTKGRLAVDHCHESGTVRGLLCERCNMALGLLDDDTDRMRKAADYVERARTMKKTG